MEIQSGYIEVEAFLHCQDNWVYWAVQSPQEISEIGHPSKLMDSCE